MDMTDNRSITGVADAVGGGPALSGENRGESPCGIGLRDETSEVGS